MFRALLRLILLLIVLVAAATYFLGYWGGDLLRLHKTGTATSVGTTVGTGVGTGGHVDTERAREAGAAVGEKTAEAANRAGKILADGALTAKIKSKMALDDTVRSRTIDVTTADHVVTVAGHVRTESERTRALQLARETDGVTRVIDHLTVDGR